MPRTATHVVELGVLGAQTGLDVAQALAVGELGEGHAQILIETGKALHLVMAAIALDTAPEVTKRKMIDQLCKNESARVHKPPPPIEAEGAWRTTQAEFKSMTGRNPKNHSITMYYISRGSKQPDSSGRCPNVRGRWARARRARLVRKKGRPVPMIETLLSRDTGKAQERIDRLTSSADNATARPWSAPRVLSGGSVLDAN